MTPEQIIKELAELIRVNPTCRIGNISQTPYIVAMAKALTFCPKCGREYKDSHYCITCGHIKNAGEGY